MERNKRQKFLGVLLIAVVLLLLVANSFLIPAAIRKTIDNIDTGSLTLSVDHIRTGFFNQSITLSGIQLYDSAGYLGIEIEKVHLGQISVRRFISRREVKVGDLVLKTPKARISKGFKFQSSMDSSKVDSVKRSLWVKNLKIDNGTFLFFDLQHKKDSILSFDIDMNIRNLLQNREGAELRYRNFGMDDAELKLNKLTWFTRDDNYKISGATLDFSTREATVQLHDLRVEPLRGQYDVGNRNGFQTDWFDASFEQISLGKIDLKKLFEEKQLWLGKVKIENAGAHTFRDLRLPMPQKPDTKLPGEMIAGIPLPVHCDSLLISNSALRYTDRAPGSDEAGNVEFSGVQLQFPNFTNIDSLIKSPLKMQLTARVLKSARLDATMTFSSAGFPHSNRVSGKVSPLPFSAFNSMIEPGLNARIDDGNIQRLNFDFTYNNYRSNGRMTMDYEGLTVHVLKEEKDRKLTSFLLNTVIVKSQNLPGDRRYQTGIIAAERDKKKSVFNYWWISILSGMKSVMT